jgi:hypothetical protein
VLVGSNNFTAPPVGYHHQWVRKKRSNNPQNHDQSALNTPAQIDNCRFHQLKNATTLGAAIIVCVAGP